MPTSKPSAPEQNARSVRDDLLQINRLWDELDRASSVWMNARGVSDTEFWILYELHWGEAPVTQANICESWGLSRQTVNSAVRRLVERGEVELVPMPGSKKNKMVVLTESGAASTRSCVDTYIGIEESSLAQFSPEERHACIDLIRRHVSTIIARLGQTDPKSREG